MIKGKEAYLKKLTASMYIPSQEVGKELDGSTPPSVFIGSWNYPKVLAGPMIAPLHGDTMVMDHPESWIPENKTQEEIIRYRLNLIRGKRSVKVTDIENRFIEKLRDISLSSSSIESEAQFIQAPKGMSFDDVHTPFGPSAPLERFEIGNSRWDRDLEKVYFDGDLKAADAVEDLHQCGLPFSNIQKAFSVGAMGMKKKRRLVPTRWSITACDSTLGNRLLQKVRDYDIIDCCQIREFASLNNYYAVLLLPTAWQYEWMEAFLRIMGNEELIFSDFETNAGKKGYSRVGGCYYSCKMAVLEALERERRQAGAIILREAYAGYVPLGVFNVRENVRNAMHQKPLEFEDMRAALGYISTKLELPVKRFIRQSDLLREELKSRQTTLCSFS
ncbi:MAG: Nre family DNA repair protein [Methanothrix sp.]|uniref:Nre family DNA repair protein n=1 Tax=Methanothrix sp. TaxID=90426 RepID=UPI0025F2DEAD|nr:Nre family DNA repair protein [Methanothrix sp.]MCK9406195.1 Nre family DNA repair protein [Methanothrix sp.]